MSSCVSSLRQNVISGSPMTPTSCIIGSISPYISSKKLWKLCGSGHSSSTMILPSAP